MSFKHTAQYHWNVNLLGKSALRFARLKKTVFPANTEKWTQDGLAPPLNAALFSKELVSRHYLKGNFANLTQKVAWVTSGAPVEFLKALDFTVHYPENHAAVCGTVRQVETIASQAEALGYSRDICSYARTDIGSVVSGITPVGKLPRPDLLLACTNICQTVLQWYRVLADHFKVPLILVDTPFIYDQAEKHAIDFVQRQLEDAIGIAEKVAGKSLKMSRFEQVTHYAQQASFLWAEILSSAKHQPAPLSVFDQFIQMAPIVEMRGDAATVDFYARMLKEVHSRIAQGIGAVVKERKRLLWDNLPIWFKMRWMAGFFGRQGIVISASTYTNAWAELANMFDPQHPLESSAITYMHPILNQGTGHKLNTMRNMIREFHLDGAILHSDRSCKPYSMGQMDQRDALLQDPGIPAILLEADHNDPRSYSEEQSTTRLQAFVEMLENE